MPNTSPLRIYQKACPQRGTLVLDVLVQTWTAVKPLIWTQMQLLILWFAHVVPSKRDAEVLRTVMVPCSFSILPLPVTNLTNRLETRL
jgi:hypothetical protein